MDATMQRDLLIEKQVGEGAFGNVFRARHLALDIPVAVKVLKSASVGAAARRMFASEARLLARLDHPNVLRVYDYRDTGVGDPLIITEWMDGGPVEAAPDAASIVSVGVAVASALAAIHDAGIIHRDVKPANMLRRADGRVKLADLGIALSRESPMDGLAGTVPYMAPELLDEPPRYSPASDIYATAQRLARRLAGG